MMVNIYIYIYNVIYKDIHLFHMNKESISLYSSGKRVKVFGPRWEIVLVLYYTDLTLFTFLWRWCAGFMKMKIFFHIFWFGSTFCQKI